MMNKLLLCYVIFPAVTERNQWVDTPPVILAGHRSIVNQVRYNRQRCLLASSGVEKIIKVRPK